MLFEGVILIGNALLNLVGYQTPAIQFKTLSISCLQIGSNSFLEVDAEILDSALFLNQLSIVERDSEITLAFMKRLAAPQKRIFTDKIIVSTKSRTSIEDSPKLSASWHKTRISIGNLSGHSYRLNVSDREGSRPIGQCKFNSKD